MIETRGLTKSFTKEKRRLTQSAASTCPLQRANSSRCVPLNPLGLVVRAERALFAVDFANTIVLHGAAAAVSVAVVGLGVGIRAMRS